MVGDLIAYMQSQGAWIATCEEVARYVLSRFCPGWENSRTGQGTLENGGDEK